MDRRHAIAVAALAVVLLAVVVSQSSLLFYLTSPSPDEYDRATVTATDADGTTLATVAVRIADTREKRYVGLSETASLSADEGMLFVHSSEGQWSYVMRNMSFALDILFVAPNGTITTVHHAGVPPAGTSGSALQSYSGHGKYVLEVERGWANRSGVGPGDRLWIPPSARNASD
jgi:uncharacterized membrane protein (UPF0127 family)